MGVGWLGKLCFELGHCLAGGYFAEVWDLVSLLGLGGFLVSDRVGRGCASVGEVHLALGLLSRGCQMNSGLLQCLDCSVVGFLWLEYGLEERPWEVVGHH